MKLVLRLYFKKIRIEGIENIPRDKPLLVTPNHQNAFLDALIVGSFMPIPLHFLTRSDVFVSWSKPILKLLNMIPIYRMRDGYATLSRNDAIFETCKDLFKNNKSVLIFPEGNHGEHYYLRPLTKGAARIALKSQIELDNDLMILPVGLNYFRHQSPRSTLLMVFGHAISVRDYEDQFKDNPAKSYNSLKEEISVGMKNTLAIPEQIDSYEAKTKAVFQLENEDLPLESLRAISSDAPEVTTYKRPKVFAKLLNPLPFLVIRRVIAGVDDIVFHSSLKLAVGLFVFPIWWLLVFVIISLLWGTPIAALSVLVMISGLFYSYE